MGPHNKTRLKSQNKNFELLTSSIRSDVLLSFVKKN